MSSFVSERVPPLYHELYHTKTKRAFAFGSKVLWLREGCNINLLVNEYTSACKSLFKVFNLLLSITEAENVRSETKMTTRDCAWTTIAPSPSYGCPIMCLLLPTVLWPGRFLLLHAVVSGGETHRLQISIGESPEVVPAGKNQNSPSIKLVIFQNNQMRCDLHKAFGILLRPIKVYLCLLCAQVEKHRDHLINYIIFLRITPFLPNWFINITSPVINVPLGVFFIGTFLGKPTQPFCHVSFSCLPVTHPCWICGIHRSRPTIFCSDQCRHDTVQANNGRGGCVLELSGCARDSGRALNPASLLSEKTAEETRVERQTTSSPGPSIPSPRLRNVQLLLHLLWLGLLLGEFRALAWEDMLVGGHQDSGNIVILGRCLHTWLFPLSFIVAHLVHKSKSCFYLRNLSLYDLWQLKVLLENFFFLRFMFLSETELQIWNWRQ